MAHRWVVRLLGDDGTAVEGRLDVAADRLEFRAGTQGSMIPPVVIGKDQIERVEPIDRGFARRVELTLADGHHVTIDNGLRPTADLVAALTGEPADG